MTTATTAPSKADILAGLAQFGNHYNYDTSYVQEIVDIDMEAFGLYNALTEMGKYQKDIPVAPYFTAKILAVLSEDCGPCTQLGITLGQEAGIPTETLRAVLAGDTSNMPEDVRLVYHYTVETLAHSPNAAQYREEIISRWGKKALLSLALGMIAGRSYPTLRYAIGHGKSCSRIMVDGEPATIKRA